MLCPWEAHLSEPIREVVLVVSDHGVPSVHQQTPLGSLSCPEDTDNQSSSTLHLKIYSQTQAEQKTVLLTEWNQSSGLQCQRTVWHTHWHYPPMLQGIKTKKARIEMVWMRQSHIARLLNISISFCSPFLYIFSKSACSSIRCPTCKTPILYTQTRQNMRKPHS